MIPSFIHSFIHWHNPRSVPYSHSQLHSSELCRMLCTTQSSVRNSCSGLRSFFVVRSQEVAGNRDVVSILELGGLWSAAATTLWWSSLGEARARWPKDHNRMYLTKSDRGSRPVVFLNSALVTWYATLCCWISVVVINQSWSSLIIKILFFADERIWNCSV